MARSPHEPTDACSPLHCYVHQVDEPAPARGRVYLVCGECGHLYRTAWHLRLADWRAYRRATRRWARPAASWLAYWRGWWRTVMLRPDRIYSCPHCAADF